MEKILTKSILRPNTYDITSRTSRNALNPPKAKHKFKYELDEKLIVEEK